MAHLILDRVLETTTTTGTGIITLNGNVAGFRAFSLLGNGNTTDYLIIDEDRNQWEIGIGTYGSSGNTLSRTTVVLSTNSNNAVNFQTGTKYVKITNAASKTITTDNISTYAQPLDADLTAIAALTGTTGLLKKTAANTWTLDTSAYLTGITSGMVTTALGFTPYNATNPSGYYSSGSNASFGTLSASSTVTLSGGTANGVAYLNASKVLTTGSALTFDGSRFAVTTSTPATTPSWLSADTAVLSQTSNSILQLHVGVSGGVTGIGFSTGSTRNAGLISFDTGSPSFIYSLSGTEQMRLTSTGLGIGMSLPSTRLDLGVSSNAGLRIRNGVQNVTSLFYNQTDGSTLIRGATDAGTGFLVFETGVGTERMRIDSSGNLLVGTTSTISGAHVSITNTNAGQAGLGIGNTGGSSLTTAISFRNSNGEVGTIQTNGSATAYNTSSDYRLKTVLGSVSGSGERIDSLEPVEYEWKSDGLRTRGFLAHKFQEVYPNSVTGEKDAVDDDGKPVYQTMQASTSEVIADLVAEIQSLRKRITTLEAK
jgi:hypothetical protein